MKNLMKIISAIFLILVLSSCQDNLNTPVKPKIDASLEKIQYESIRSLSDITAVAFEWRKVDDVRVVGYNLYRANALENKGKLKLIKFIENKYTTHYLDTELEANTTYIYAFSTVKSNGFESTISRSLKIITMKRPESVALIQVISNLPKQIKIVWRPHTNEQIAYYKIQRSSNEDPEWDTLSRIEGRLQAEYIDKNLDNNVVYKYRLLSYTFKDIQSRPSKIVLGQTKALPKGVVNLKASKDLAKTIKLQWSPSSQKDIAYYVVYENSSSTGSFSKVVRLNKNTFSYNYLEVEPGKSIFFKVTAIDNDKLESSINKNPVMGITLNKPEKPIMTLAQITENKAILNWNKGDNRVKSFIVYKTIQNGYFDKKSIRFTNITKLRFEDKDIVKGIEYKYSIQAVDEFGILSDKTEESLLKLRK
ncbi:MAG: fibronectin type III domain-containing protein [Campylobacteraceae bacterium]|nr:fibronectin type III domain-containing protein [Campylobacteraceae bacterium]